MVNIIQTYDIKHLNDHQIICADQIPCQLIFHRAENCTKNGTSYFVICYSCNFWQADMTLLFPNPAPPLLQKILNILKNDVAISLQRMNKRSFDQDRGMHAASPPKKPGFLTAVPRIAQKNGTIGSRPSLFSGIAYTVLTPARKTQLSRAKPPEHRCAPVSHHMFQQKLAADQNKDNPPDDLHLSSQAYCQQKRRPQKKQTPPHR